MKAISFELGKECSQYASDFLKKKPALDVHNLPILEKLQSCFELVQKEHNFVNGVEVEESNSIVLPSTSYAAFNRNIQQTVLPSTSNAAFNRNIQPTVLIERLNVNESTLAFSLSKQY
jgi:hypothetical protein